MYFSFERRSPDQERPLQARQSVGMQVLRGRVVPVKPLIQKCLFARRSSGRNQDATDRETERYSLSNDRNVPFWIRSQPTSLQ
jgi:hypothetical protein